VRISIVPLQPAHGHTSTHKFFEHIDHMGNGV